ncbi:NrfD/PsrC family molybdoenzyme membrane anchor subunit [Pseudomonadota bacterium]
MAAVHYHTTAIPSRRFYALLGFLGLWVFLGLYAAHQMETYGHHITGMNNQVVWGVPHVFAVFLIIAASGALNVASVASVFNIDSYRPLSRLSALLAIALLIGGLAVLVLDLGRPDRLIVAMTHYNFKSIFAWNIFLYTGFAVILVVYLWLQMEPRLNHLSRYAGLLAFGWRLILTSGTGLIFGLLVARQAYDAAILAPMFILMSLSLGTAVFILVMLAIYRFMNMTIVEETLNRFKKLLGMFVLAVVYIVTVYHLSNLYVSEHSGIERFILLDGGTYTLIFWVVQVVMGSLIPLLLIYSSIFSRLSFSLALAALLVVIGGIGQLYVLIVGGQAYPLNLFPGMEVSSSFYDGEIAQYSASIFEILLGVGGVAFALAVVWVGIRVLPLMPNNAHIESPVNGSRD